MQPNKNKKTNTLLILLVIVGIIICLLIGGIFLLLRSFLFNVTTTSPNLPVVTEQESYSPETEATESLVIKCYPEEVVNPDAGDDLTAAELSELKEEEGAEPEETNTEEAQATKSDETETAKQDAANPTEEEGIETAKPETVTPTEEEKIEVTEPKSDAEEVPVYYFRNQKLLNQHYEKHGIEMGFASAEEYEAAASAIVTNPDSLFKLEAEDGDYVYYLESENAFVIVSTDGYLRTFFYPNAGKAYFDRQ